MQDEYMKIAKRLQDDSESIANRMRIEYDSIAKRSQGDSERDCESNAKRLRNDRKVLAHNFKAIVNQL